MNKEYLKKRGKAFLWNIGSVALVAFLGALIEPEVVKAIGINGLYLVILKEVVAQVTKAINSK